MYTTCQFTEALYSCTSTSHDWHVPADRRIDRHEKGSRAQISVGAELWAAFGKAVGNGERSRVVRELIAWYLGIGPQPEPHSHRGSSPRKAAKKAPVPKPEIPAFTSPATPDKPADPPGTMRLANGKLVLRPAPKTGF